MERGNLDKMMEELKLTDYKIAKGAQISQSSLSSWKRGEGIPRRSTLQKIADYLDCTVDYLVGAVSEPKQILVKGTIVDISAAHDTTHELAHIELHGLKDSVDRALKTVVDKALEEQEDEERYRPKANELRELFAKQLDKLSPSNQVYFLSRLERALEYSSRDKSWEGIIKSLADYSSSYGEMMLASWEMRFSSIEKPNDYLRFLKHYQRCMNITEEHRKLLIEQAMDFLHDDNSKLKELVERK